MRLREVERGDRLVWRFLIWFISLVSGMRLPCDDPERGRRDAMVQTPIHLPRLGQSAAAARSDMRSCISVEFE